MYMVTIIIPMFMQNCQIEVNHYDINHNYLDINIAHPYTYHMWYSLLGIWLVHTCPHGIQY